MAKDPAILWYWNDWQGGTATLSRHLKGCYMDLLHAQFNCGRLSLEEIKNVLGNDFASWGILCKKFKKDSEDKFFNERIELEKIKRENFSDKQRNNRLGKTKSKPNQNLLENGNEIVNKNLVLKEKIVFEKISEILNSHSWIESTAMQLKENYDTLTCTLEDFLNEQKLKEEIENRSIKEIKSHFINWLKKEKEKNSAKKENGTRKQTNWEHLNSAYEGLKTD